MFFTKIGTILAYLCLIFGILRMSMGVFILVKFNDIESFTAATERYLGSTRPGEAIDRGALYIFVAVALGTLCEISKNVRAIKDI